MIKSKSNTAALMHPNSQKTLDFCRGPAFEKACTVTPHNAANCKQQTHKAVPLAHGLLAWLDFNSHRVIPKLFLKSIHSHKHLAMQKWPQQSK